MLIISFGIFTTIYGYSQTPLGIKGGLQATALTRESTTLNGEALGFMAGVFFHPISKHPFTGEVELLISGKGAPEYRTTYLEIPILVNFKIARTFFVGGGGYMAFNIGSPVEAVINGTAVEANYEFFDAGYIFEFGYWKEKIELGFRFEKAITNSFSIDNLNYKNRAWLIYVGYHL